MAVLSVQLSEGLAELKIEYLWLWEVNNKKQIKSITSRIPYWHFQLWMIKTAINEIPTFPNLFIWISVRSSFFLVIGFNPIIKGTRFRILILLKNFTPIFSKNFDQYCSFFCSLLPTPFTFSPQKSMLTKSATTAKNWKYCSTDFTKILIELIPDFEFQISTSVFWV